MPDGVKNISIIFKYVRGCQKMETYDVTPRDDAYVFEAVKGGVGLGYEVSHHMVSGQIPQTFILVDTSNGETLWTPNGRYVYGESNYEVVYCCDVLTSLEYTTDYKRVNLEDCNYYSKEAAKHIRAILQNAYPYLTLDEMKANMKANGLNAEFADSLTRSDIISAVQMAVWSYANASDSAQDHLKIYAISSNADGDKTDSISYVMDEESKIQLSIKAKAGDTIKVYVEGTQYIAKGVYFYESEGGRDVSQSLVGVGEGTTKVKAEKTFVFNPDITFDVYKAEPAEGESLGEIPTEEEMARYIIEDNKVGSVVTDVTGYAFLELDKGTYLVVELHNAEKVKAPVAPFYIRTSEEKNRVCISEE